MSGIRSEQRWRHDRRCPVCGGHPGLKPGTGTRCTGWMSDDGWLHCSRPEHAGEIEAVDGPGTAHPTYAHIAAGTLRNRHGEPIDCRCGKVHGVAPPPASPATTTPPGLPIRRVSYRFFDANGRLVAVHQRREYAARAKDFIWLHPDGRPSRRGHGVPVAPADLMYRLPELLAAPRECPVVACEGEKAACAVVTLKVPNLVAVGFGCGAHVMPSDAVLALLVGRRVFLWPDHDEPGAAFMRHVAERLRELGAAEIRVILWGDEPKDDAADFVERGGSAAELIKLAQDAAPALAVLPAAPDPDDPVFFWDTVRLRDIEYLWEPRIPLRKVTVLAGHPGIGKSYIVSALAASITVGRGLPECGEFEPRAVLFCSREDDIDDTLGPRVRALGGDLSRIGSLRKPISFDRKGMKVLREAVKRHHPRFLIFDTLSAFVGDVDMNTANEMRGVFTELRELCGEFELSVLLLTHFNKAGGSEALLRIIGSVDTVGAARSVLITGLDPQDRSLRHLLHVKINAGWQAGGLCYRITRSVENPSVADFVWAGPSGITEAELMGGKAAGVDPTVLNAEKLIRHMLAPGPQNGEEIRKRLRDQGVGLAAIGAASRLVDVQYAGHGKQMVWHLPPVTRSVPAEVPPTAEETAS